MPRAFSAAATEPTSSASCPPRSAGSAQSTTRSWPRGSVRRSDGEAISSGWSGPALVHSRARADFEWFIRNGYVQAVLAGNAVAVHDIEAAIFGTTLGMSNTGQPTEGGHGLHMRAINRVRAAGSIERAVETGMIKSGIMHALVTNRVPYVLAGSIRDDGPLPGVYSDALAGPGRHARAHRQGDRGHLRRHRAPRHRGREHAAGLLPVRRGAGSTDDHLRRSDRVRGQQAQGPGHPPGLRRGHQRPGFHARAAVLRRAMGAGRRHDRAIARNGVARPRGGTGWPRPWPRYCLRPRWTESGSSRPLRRETKEWGTAVLSRVDGDRRRIYTARYVLAIKGKERGKFEASVQEVGSGPLEALDRLLQEAQRRIDDEHPPISVSPESWFPRSLPRIPGRWPDWIRRRQPPIPSAFAVTSGSITSRSPASGISWLRSSSWQTNICRSKQSAGS